MIDFSILNEPQGEAVRTTEGPLLVLAGAGSGKTRVLTHRAAYLIEELSVNPWNVLCITFTNKAAKEMRERIDTLITNGSEDITVSTFHSLCLHILFKYADRVGYDKNFEICDASDQKSVIKDVCKKLEIDTKMFKERSLLGAISSAKDELIDPVRFREEATGDYRKERIAQVYTEYQNTLKKNNSFDFDDLIMKVCELFKQCPDVLDYYQERYRYIMVDEYQDTNTAQFQLVRLLSMKYRNLCVVGDDDQSIYRFRGANIYNILDFEKTYPEARVVRLEQNYRSTGNILEAANEVISNNQGRKVKRLWTEAEAGSKIHFKTLANAPEEAMYVAEDIRNRVRNGEFKYGDCAILMRTNIQSKEFEDAFRVLGIDYDLVKGLRFWDTKVIKDLTSYLLTVATGLNDMRAVRIINVPKRGIGNASIDKISDYALTHGISFMEACERAEDIPGIGRAYGKIKDFADMILALRERMTSLSMSELLNEIIDAVDYMSYLNAEADTPEKFEELKEYINKLGEALDAYEKDADEPDLVDFMRQNGVEGNNVSTSLEGAEIAAVMSPEEEAQLKEKRVLIMTMHNAKGLEFPCVYLVGMEDGLFPSYMTVVNDDPDELEEERRLCYVALTRARKELTITAAKQRMVNGETRYSKTSQFVKEIPFALLDMGFDKPAPVKKSMPEIKKAIPVAETAGTPLVKRGFGSLDDGSYKKKAAAIKRKPAPNAYSTYAQTMKGSQIGVVGELSYGVGDRVRHVKFGEGTVLEIRNGGRDYEVTVSFDTAGVKRMFAGFAKLIKV